MKEKKISNESLRTPNFYVGKRKAVIGVDCSNKFKDLFIEIPPFAKDENGVIVNSKDHPVLRRNGTINIDDEIQSYKDDSSLTSILKKVALTKDFTILKQVEGAYFNVSEAPRSLNEVNNFFDKTNDNFNKLSNEEKEIIGKLLGLKLSLIENKDEVVNNSFNKDEAI